MPEPDFAQIALRLWNDRSTMTHVTSAEIAEQLRLVWNARGHADREIIDAQGDDGLDRALRSLDR